MPRARLSAVTLDASRVQGELYQGGLPKEGQHVRRSGFDVLVLCAEEYQPPEYLFPGVHVVRLPMADIPVRLTAKEIRMLRLAARELAHALQRRKKVLVTCRAGWNRSGLVTAATMLEQGSATPAEAIRLIRAARGPLALNNPAFVHAIATQLRRRRS